MNKESGLRDETPRSGDGVGVVPPATGPGVEPPGLGIVGGSGGALGVAPTGPLKDGLPPPGAVYGGGGGG